MGKGVSKVIATELMNGRLVGLNRKSQGGCGVAVTRLTESLAVTGWGSLGFPSARRVG